MTRIELVRSTALTDTVPYAYAAVTPPDDSVFTAGACPLDQDGAVVSPGDVAAQAQQVMANLAVALGAAGAGLTDVAKTTVYVASGSRADLLTAWRVVCDAFGDHDAPSTLLGVAVLGYPDQLVEVEAVAVTAAGRRGREGKRGDSRPFISRPDLQGSASSWRRTLRPDAARGVGEIRPVVWVSAALLLRVLVRNCEIRSITT